MPAEESGDQADFSFEPGTGAADLDETEVVSDAQHKLNGDRIADYDQRIKTLVAHVAEQTAEDFGPFAAQEGGVANRIDPESCAVAREGLSEALTGERTGQPLRRERTLFPGADVVPVTEGHTDGRDIASARPARRGRRHWHVRTLSSARLVGRRWFEERRLL
jgi:hypothetical protein